MRPEYAGLLVLTVVVCSAAIILWSLNLRYRNRELRHRERMTAIDKGLAIPSSEPETTAWTPRVYLLRGLIWLFTGIGLASFLLGLALTVHRSESAETKVWRANNARRMGATEEEVKLIMQEHDANREGMPAATALLGLVPIGVGLAYLIVYRAEGARAMENGPRS